MNTYIHIYVCIFEYTLRYTQVCMRPHPRTIKSEYTEVQLQH